MELTGKIGSLIGKKGGQVWSVAPTASVYDAIALMAEKEIGALPIVQDGQLVGIVSERDYARKVFLNQSTFEGMGRTMADMMVRDRR